MPKVRDYLYQDKTHRGDVRYRFRWDRDAKRVTIKGQPGEPAFEREYRRLVDLHRRGVEPHSQHDRDVGSFAWLVRLYFVEMDILVDQGLMARSTRKQRTNLLKRCLPTWGIGRLNSLEPGHIQAMMGEFRSTPGQANNLLKALRAMFAFAKRENIVPIDPTREA